MSKIARASRNASLMRVETIEASADGTLAAPTKTIASAETGEIYFIDCSSNTVSVVLPALKAGAYFKFIIASAANDEATKDFILYTDSNSTDMGGTIVDGGGLTEITSTTSMITLDSDVLAGGLTTGDFIECVSDGTSWYVTGVVLGAAGIVIADNRS